jgi:hypothetical protein
MEMSRSHTQAPQSRRTQSKIVAPLSPAPHLAKVFDFAAPNTKNDDIVIRLRKLLEMAERGEVIGWAGAYMRADRTFATRTAGAAADAPVFTIGMLDIFIAELRRKVLGN